MTFRLHLTYDLLRNRRCGGGVVLQVFLNLFLL